MLFIAPLVNFYLRTSASQGFVLVSSTFGRLHLILGFCLIHVLYLSLFRMLNQYF
jgi:hypothetical protein